MAVELNSREMWTDALGEKYLEVDFAGGGVGRLYPNELDGEALGKLDLNADKLVSGAEASVRADTPEFRAVDAQLKTAQATLVKANTALDKAREPEPNWLKDSAQATLGVGVGLSLSSLVFITTAFMVQFLFIGMAVGAAFMAYQYVTKRMTPEQHAAAIKTAEAGLATAKSDVVAARAAHAAAWKKVAATSSSPAGAAPAVAQPLQGAFVKLP